ncbi:MAG: hypothetical protein DRO88_11940 [Promethearchaeia archaeon]|nr:MAG: hypothetical protein DRO88_11940 [Candidatus Lokiarchaeia archaeon]
MALDLPVADKERIKLSKSSDWQIYAIGGKGDGIINFQIGDEFFSFPVSSMRKKFIVKEITVSSDSIIIDGKGNNLEIFLHLKSLENSKVKSIEFYSHEFYSNSSIKLEIPNPKDSILTFLRFETVNAATLELLNTGLLMGHPPIHINNSITLENLNIPLTDISYFKILGNGILDGTLTYGIAREE